MKPQKAQAMTILAVLIAASAAPTALAAGSQRIVSDDGTCQMTVPANWKPMTIMGKVIKFQVNTPDDSAGAGIQSDAGFSLAQIKQIAESSSKVLKVFEDSPRRLWLQVTMEGAHGTHYYVAIPGCHADINFDKPAQLATAKQIALSIKRVH